MMSMHQKAENARVHTMNRAASLTIENVDNKFQLMHTISKRHEKQHGKDSRLDELQKVETWQRFLFVGVEIFIPVRIGHVNDELRVFEVQ